MGNLPAGPPGQIEGKENSKMPGGKIRFTGDGRLEVPDQPIIPYIEGDGVGRDIWRASVRVFDLKSMPEKRPFIFRGIGPLRRPSKLFRNIKSGSKAL
jgi:hypothetical protein